MSLLSILSDRNNQELRDKLKTEFLRPNFNLQAELKAPPLTSNYGTVGTAFDYLMRFYLQHHNKKTFIQRDIWVADHSYNALTKQLSGTKQKEIATGFKRDKIFNTKDLLHLLTEQYAQTKMNYKEFVSSGKVTDQFVSNTIFLAKLDVYFRTGIIDQNFDYHNPDDVKDIKKIISIVDKKLFTAKEKCYFNPTFGSGSGLVGGADADLIIDNTLIDIKATKHLKLEREHLNQVLGYYILSLIGGINSNKQDKPIKNIGIYFARHGELWTIPLLHFGDKKKFDDFKEWFVSFVSQRHPSLDKIKELIETLKTEENKKKQQLKKKTSKKGIKYFIDSLTESVDCVAPQNIILSTALERLKNLKEDDHIGFINEKDECIQFRKENRGKWTIDCPILDKKDKYLHSLVDNNLTIKKVSAIISLFFSNKPWEHLCKLKRLNSRS